MMFNPIALALGWRYCLGQRRQGFMGFIALTSVLGLILGTAVLITVLSVMNGFVKDIRQVFLAQTPQVMIEQMYASDPDVHRLQSILYRKPFREHVVSIMPMTEKQVLLMHGQAIESALVIGINPQQLPKVFIEQYPDLTASLSQIKRGQTSMIITPRLANRLHLDMSSKITKPVNMAIANRQGASLRPVFIDVNIVDMTTASGLSTMPIAIMHMSDTQQLFAKSGSIHALRLWLDDPSKAQLLARKLAFAMPRGIQIVTWMDQHMAYFKAVATEKTMMTLILFLIIIIAVFNLMTSLMMMINDKRADIAVLMTMGMPTRKLIMIFMYQGLITVTIGLSIGVGLGVFMAHNITALVMYLERLLSISLIDQSVYGLSYLPCDLQIDDILKIVGLTFILAFFALLYPSIRASRMLPSRVLRHV